ncbi:MAG: hypothetical protein ACI8R9_000388 [Paraglaciecola sp.]|jgi:hypothetical protein
MEDLMRPFIYFCLLSLLIACSQSTPLIAQEAKITKERATVNEQVKFTGRVRFMTIEGGFYALYADDGRVFNPSNLAKKYQQDGLLVVVTGQILTDMMSYQQHGKMLQVTSIKIIGLAEDSSIR